MNVRMMIAIVASTALAVTALAAAPPASQPTTKMSMGDMMKQCMGNCQAVSKSIDDTSKAIDEARNSNDPEKMKAALDQAQKQLAQMRQHMSTCMDMMGMMQQMHGGMMGGMKGGMMDKGTQKKQ